MTEMVGNAFVSIFCCLKINRRNFFAVNDLKKSFFRGTVWHAIRFVYQRRKKVKHP
jgi:hypothetical protein